MYLKKPPALLRSIYSSLIWSKANKSKVVYLTFDDGPNLDSTEAILDILSDHDVTATFFCQGRNIDKYPTLFDRIKKENHTVANHGYDHLDGWKTDRAVYLDNIKKAEKHFDNKLFRPPYGRISPIQIQQVKKDYEIVMWSYLTGDFEKDMDPKKCLADSIKNTTSGTVIVFHDSEKAKRVCTQVLPAYIEAIKEKGLCFGKLD